MTSRGSGNEGNGAVPSHNGAHPSGGDEEAGEGAGRNKFARARRPLGPEDMTCLGCGALFVLVVLSIAFWLFIYWRNADEFRVSQVEVERKMTVVRGGASRRWH